MFGNSKFSCILSLTLFILCDSCVKEIKDKSFESSLRVTGGYRPAEQPLAKHIVSLKSGSYKLYFGDNHYCGGSIISEKVVLTAAHCVLDSHGKKMPIEKISLVAGSPLLLKETPTTRVYKVKKVVPHPTFSLRTLRGDIALIFVEGTIEEDNVHSQRVDLADSAPESGTQCITFGWGRIFNDGPRPEELVYVNLTLFRRLKCQEYYHMNPGVICAGDPKDWEKGVWKGDSGGPLICNNKLTGVVSFGYPSVGAPNYFSSVYEYRNWILENVAASFESKFMLFLVILNQCLYFLVH